MPLALPASQPGQQDSMSSRVHTAESIQGLGNDLSSGHSNPFLTGSPKRPDPPAAGLHLDLGGHFPKFPCLRVHTGDNTQSLCNPTAWKRLQEAGPAGSHYRVI